MEGLQYNQVSIGEDTLYNGLKYVGWQYQILLSIVSKLAVEGLNGTVRERISFVQPQHQLGLKCAPIKFKSRQKYYDGYWCIRHRQATLEGSMPVVS